MYVWKTEQNQNRLKRLNNFEQISIKILVKMLTWAPTLKTIQNDKIWLRTFWIYPVCEQ